MSIHVLTDGVCSNVDIKKTSRGFSLDRRTLHVHHKIQNPNIALASPFKVSALQSEKTPLFTFQLPPPLNAFIYPSPIYAIYLDEDENIVPIEAHKFETMCVNLGALALVPPETAAVYDVPAVPLNFGDDENVDDEYDEDNIIDEDEESGDDDDDLDDDDEWVADDDDDIGSTA